MHNIVKINTYLTDIRHRAELAAIREEFLGKKAPASTLVGGGRAGACRTG